MFSKTKQKAKQIVQTHGVSIGVVAGVAGTYAVMRKFDLDVASVRKQAYEQGMECAREIAMLEYDVSEMYNFIKEKGGLEDLAEFTGWTLLENGSLQVGNFDG